MASNRANNRRRAGIVCTQCHSRKVKCDLQQRPEGPCSNCQKADQPCQRRRSLRKRAPQARLPVAVASAGEEQAYQSEPQGILTSNDNDTPPSRPRNGFAGYLAKESFLSNSCAPEVNRSESAEAASISQKILQVTGATVLPSRPLVEAFIDVYFTHLFPMVPVVDRCDLTLEPPSTLILQTICLVGSHFRHPQKSVPSAHHFYRKVKTLLDVNDEEDSLSTLKSQCLVASRSAESPTNISMDSPWHWSGVAIRYAFNMGLHREETYAAKPNAGPSRRVWWHLFNQDKLQSLCYGRPPAIRLHEVDVELPTVDDFSEAHPDNEIFIERTKLCLILGKVSDAQYGRQLKSFLEEATNIGEYLKEWITNLPPSLHLYDGFGARRTYNRHVFELHIMYFTGLILFYRLLESPRLGSTPLKVSIVAASCIARLFEEIYYRNEVISILPINNWYCTVASVALIHAIRAFPTSSSLRHEELGILRLVLQEMTVNTPSSNLILKNIDRIQNLVLEENSSASALRLPQEQAIGDEAAHVRCIDPVALFPFPASICPSMDMLPLPTTNGIDSRDDGVTASSNYLGTISNLAFNFDLGDVQLDGTLPFFEEEFAFEQNFGGGITNHY